MVPKLDFEPGLSALRASGAAAKRLLAGAGSLLAVEWVGLTIVTLASISGEPWYEVRPSWTWLGEAAVIATGVITLVALGLQRGRRASELVARIRNQREDENVPDSLALLSAGADWQQELDLGGGMLYVAAVLLPFLALSEYLSFAGLGVTGLSAGASAELAIVFGLGVPLGLGVYGIAETIDAAPRAGRAAREISRQREALVGALATLAGDPSGLRAANPEGPRPERTGEEPAHRLDLTGRKSVRLGGTLLGISVATLVVAVGLLTATSFELIGVSRISPAIFLALTYGILGVLFAVEFGAFLVGVYGVRAVLRQRRARTPPGSTPNGPVERALVGLTQRESQLEGAGEALRWARRGVLLTGIIGALIPVLLGVPYQLSSSGLFIEAFYRELPFLAVPLATLAAVRLAWIGARLEADRREFHTWLLRLAGVEAEFWARYWS